MRTRSTVLSLLALVSLLAGCAQGPEGALAETAASLEEIDSGVMKIELIAIAGQGAEEARTGFMLEGPFALPGEDELPVTDLEYTQLAGDETSTTGFVSTEDSAYVVVDGQAYELAPEQVESIRGSGEEASDVFEGADFANWIRSPRVEDGPRIDGEPTEHVVGDLDVVTALNDIFEVARMFGADESVFGPIEDSEAEHLRSAVESATLDLVTGSEDRLLRSLDIAIRFDTQHHEELADVLDSLAGVGFTFRIEIADPNKAVEIEPPADALPITELVPVEG